MKPGHRLWTDDEVSRLIEMKRSGTDKRDIAAELGRTVESCANKLSSIVSLIKVPEPMEAAEPVVRHKSFTAFVMGDPLPGRSALDQRRAGGMTSTSDIGERAAS